MKTWASEKIKNQVKSEYDRGLETHKSQLNMELEKLKSKLKSESDIEVEKFKSELSIVAAENQFRFSRPHEKQAEVIAEVYASLNHITSQRSEYVKHIKEFGPIKELGKISEIEI